MIKFFRNIRKALIEESKTTKYLKYAIGEIVLVVIGILIALQINNWNEHRKNNNEETLILKSIKREITVNQTLLSNEITEHTKGLRLLKELNSYISPEPIEIENNKLDSLMYGLGWLPRYTPKDGVINSIITSGKISLVKNNTLSSMLSSLNSLFNDYNTSFKWTERDVFEHIIPYIKSKYPFGRTLEYFSKEIKKDSKFEYSKNDLLSDLGFESLVANRIIDARDILKRAEKLYDFQSEILVVIDNELKR